MSINPLQDLCDQVAAVLGAVEGIRRATGQPPEQISEFPFVDVYVMGATWEPVPNGTLKAMVTLNIDLHVARKDQPRDAVTLNRFLYGVVNALYKAQRDTAIPALSAILGTTSQLSVFATNAANGYDTVGYRITPTIKVMQTIT